MRGASMHCEPPCRLSHRESPLRFQMAIVANACKKPFYVASESTKFARMFPLSQLDLPKTEQVRGGTRAPVRSSRLEIRSVGCRCALMLPSSATSHHLLN